MGSLPETRKTILAIHGAGMHAGVWGGITPHLLDYHLKAVSLPGHEPKSTENPLSSIPGMAAWIRRRMESAAAGSHILLGHSMGACVALAAAADPAVAGVVLLGAAPKMPVHPDLLKKAFEKPAEAADLVLKWGIYPGHTRIEAMRTVVHAIQQGANPAALGPDLQACNDYQGIESDARTLQKPCLVISGAEDKMTKAEAGEALAALMPMGKSVKIEDCGHMIMVEKPIEAAREIKTFLAR